MRFQTKSELFPDLQIVQLRNRNDCFQQCSLQFVQQIVTLEPLDIKSILPCNVGYAPRMTLSG